MDKKYSCLLAYVWEKQDAQLESNACLLMQSHWVQQYSITMESNDTLMTWMGQASPILSDLES